MPVFNREDYVSQSINSILNQTFREFEFIIINDGSTDHTKEILAQFGKRDSRIRIIDNEENIGFTKSISKGIKYASGDFIARMDSDDISFLNRFELQLSYLKKNIDNIDVLGAQYYKINESNIIIGDLSKRPYSSNCVWWDMFFYTSIAHPTVLAKTSCYSLFNENGIEESFYDASDYAFWTRIGFTHKFSNMKIPVLYFRRHKNRVTDISNNQQIQSAEKATKKAIFSALRKDYPIEAIRSLKYMGTGNAYYDAIGVNIIKELFSWFTTKYHLTNNEIKYIQKQIFLRLRSIRKRNSLLLTVLNENKLAIDEALTLCIKDLQKKR